MENKDHIEDLFRKRAEDFELQPSASAWERLEQRLEESEQAPKTKIFSMYRVSAIAACAVGLVACVTVVSWLFDHGASHTTASKVELEDLELSAEEGKAYARFVALQPNLNYEEANIQEGTSGSRLIARNSKPFVPDDQALVQTEMQKAVNPIALVQKLPSDPSTDKEGASKKKSATVPSRSTPKQALSPIETSSVPSIEEPVVLSEATVLEEEAFTKVDVLDEVVITQYDLPEPTTQEQVAARGIRSEALFDVEQVTVADATSQAKKAKAVIQPSASLKAYAGTWTILGAPQKDGNQSIKSWFIKNGRLILDLGERSLTFSQDPNQDDRWQSENTPVVELTLNSKSDQLFLSATSKAAFPNAVQAYLKEQSANNFQLKLARTNSKLD